MSHDQFNRNNQPWTDMSAEAALASILNILKNGSISVSGGGGGGGSSVLYPTISHFSSNLGDITLPGNSGNILFIADDDKVGGPGNDNLYLPLISSVPAGARVGISNNSQNHSWSITVQGSDLLWYGQTSSAPFPVQSSMAFVSDGINNWIPCAIDPNSGNIGQGI